MKIIKEAKISKYDGMFWSEFFNEYQKDGNKLPKTVKKLHANTKLPTGRYMLVMLNNVKASYAKDYLMADGSALGWDLTDTKVKAVEENKIVIDLGERASYLALNF